CWHGAQDEEAASEQGVSIEVSLARTPKPGPSIGNAQPCGTCSSLLKDILSLAEQGGTHPGQGLYTWKVGRTSQPAQALSSTSLFMVWESHMGTLQMERTFKMGKVLTSAINVGKPSAITIHLLTKRRSTLENSFMSIGNVGRPFLESPTMSNIRKSTLSLGFMSAQNVGYSLQKYLASKTTREFTQGQGLLSAAFFRPSQLVGHQKIHTEERTYGCSECGKFFRNCSTLIRHQRVHTGERPFECTECGRAFTCKHRLVEYQKIHSGEKTFECRACGKAFSHKGTVVEHQRIHTGERPYKCSKYIGQIPLEKGLISAANVGNFCSKTPESVHTSEFTLITANKGTSLHTTLVLLSTVEFTPEKCLLSAVSAGMSVAKTSIHLAPKSSHQRKNL
ncbi:hypothetical protein EI555_007961, partial [Monodon monoceros]